MVACNPTVNLIVSKMTSSPTPSSTSDTTSSSQAQFVYWFNGLFPILTSIITPLTVYRKVLRKPNVSDVQRYNDLLQEVSRQFVSGTIGLISYFGGGELTRGLLKIIWKPSGSPSESNDKPNRSDNSLKMLIGGQVLSFIGYSFVRPWLATDILYLLRKQATPEGKAAPPSEPIRSPWKRSIVDWVDRHLMKDGTPRLGKAAVFSFLALGAYLNALAFVIYGLSRLFGAQPDKATSSPKSPPAHPTLIPPTLINVPFPPGPGPQGVNASGRLAAYHPAYYAVGRPDLYGAMTNFTPSPL